MHCLRAWIGPCALALVTIIACQWIVPLHGEEPITPISMILVNPSALHRKLLKVEGIVEEVIPYQLHDGALGCGARFKVTDPTGTVQVSLLQHCRIADKLPTIVNEGLRVIVEGTMEAPSTVVRNPNGKDNDVVLQARSVMPSVVKKTP
jgi:cytochrome c-type biogenesis protein CcmE